MNRKVIFGALFTVVMCANINAGDEGAAAEGNFFSRLWGSTNEFMQESMDMNKVTPVVLGVALAARPMWNIVNQVAGYGWNSLVGVSHNQDENSHNLNVRVLGANAELGVPALEALPFGGGERSFWDVVNALKPRVAAGIEDDNSPLVVDDAVDAEEMRAYCEGSLGAWRGRVACNVNDLLMVPAVLVAAYLWNQYGPAMPFGGEAAADAEVAAAGDAADAGAAAE